MHSPGLLIRPKIAQARGVRVSQGSFNSGRNFRAVVVLEGQEEGDSCTTTSVMASTAIEMNPKLLSRPLTGTPEEEEEEEDEAAWLSFQHSPLALLSHPI